MQKQTINIIKEELDKRNIEARKILLFGSRARGDNRRDSDWDFLVIVKQHLEWNEKWEIIISIKRRLARLKIPNDILINSERQIQEKRNDVGLLTYYALKEGIEI